MLRHSGVKFELEPNRAQRDLLASFAGTARFVWNWGLAKRQEHYNSVVVPARGRGEVAYPLSAYELITLWNSEKDTLAPWYRGCIASQVATQALLDLGMAFSNFLTPDKNGKRAGFPKFKAKGYCLEAFRLPGDTTKKVVLKGSDEPVTRVYKLKIEKGRVHLTNIGWVRIKNDPTPRLARTRVTSITISSHAGRWYASCAVEKEVEQLDPIYSQASALGIDAGVHTFMVCSDGRRIEGREPLKEALSEVRRLSRDVSRKENVRDGVKTRRMKKREAHQAHQEGRVYWPTKAERQAQKAQRKANRETQKSQRAAELAALQEQVRVNGLPVPVRLSPRTKSHRQQAREKQLAQTHRKVANRRSNFIHELTTRLVRRARKRGTTLAIEGLKVKNLMAGGLGRQIADLGWSEFRRQLTYKCDWYGVGLYIAPTFYPSSKTCSRCGQLKADLARSEWVYHCDRCGLVLDRDLNAARNLQKQAVMAIARGETSRPGSSGQVSSSRKRAPGRKIASNLAQEQILSAPAQ